MSDAPEAHPSPGQASEAPVDADGVHRSTFARLFGRASLNVADQALSALTNVALVFLVARAMAADSFGAFSVAFLTFSIFIGLERALVGQPMNIRFSAVEGDERDRVVGAATATVLSMTTAGGLAIALVGLVLPGALGPSMLALAPVLPGLVLQDACRMTFFAQGRPHLALLNDVVWTITQFIGMGILYVRGVEQAWAYILAWGGSATLAATVGLVQLGVLPRFGRVTWWVRGQIDITGYLLLEYVMGASSTQGSILLVGAAGSLSDVGSLRAAQTLIGPLSVLGAAAMSFALPEVSRRQGSSEERTKVPVAVSGALVLVSLTYTALLLVLPDSIGAQLLGQTWDGASSVLLPIALASTASAAALGPAIVVYAMGAARKTFRLHAVQAVLMVACMVTGIRLGGAPGAAWGMAVCMAAIVPLWFWQMRTLLRHA